MDRREFIKGVSCLLGALALPRQRHAPKPLKMREIITLEFVDGEPTLWMMGRDDEGFVIVASRDWAMTFVEVCRPPDVGANAVALAVMNERLYVGYSNGDLWWSKDSGATWHESTIIIDNSKVIEW